MRVTRLALSVMVALAAIAASRTSEAAFMIAHGQFPGQGENLMFNGNYPPLIKTGNVVEGHTNQTEAVINIGLVDPQRLLTVNGGQARVEADNGNPFADFYLEVHPANDRAGYNPSTSFSRIEFKTEIAGLSGNDTTDLKITVYYNSGSMTSPYTLTGVKKNEHVHVIALNGELIQKVLVAPTETAHWFNHVQQIRFDGVNGVEIVPEPTSMALAGFAGLGMAVGAWRRRRQQAA